MRRQRGAIFVVTLAILAGLVAVMAAAALAQRMRFVALLNRVERTRARVAAESGVQRAMAELSVMTQGQAATLQDDWAKLGQTGAERFTLGETSFRVQIVDAGGRVDLNTVTENQLNRLPLTQEQIDAFLDWKSSGTTARPDGGKDDYYNNLTNPYNTALRNIESFDELLLIKGFTAQALYQPQTNVVSTATIVQGASTQQPVLYDVVTVGSWSPLTDATGQAKINILTAPPANSPQTAIQAFITRCSQRSVSQAVAAAIIASRPQTIGALLGDRTVGANRQYQREILNELCTSAGTRVEGKINLNTATESVLNTIPTLQPDIVQGILARQLQGYTQLGDVLDVPGMTGNTLTGSIDNFTVQSSAFWVRVEGVSGSAHVYLEVLVSTDNQAQPKIIRVEEPPMSDMPTRWGWATTVTTETSLEGQNR